MFSIKWICFTNNATVEKKFDNGMDLINFKNNVLLPLIWKKQIAILNY